MTNSNNLTDRASRRFQSLAFLTIIVVYLLILAGGIVRSTGSGMGCPDWPKCFGRWVPPTEMSQLPPNYQEIYGAKLKGEVEFNAVKTWIEYVNRLLGVLSGFLVFGTLIASLPYLRKNKTVFWGSLAAFILIGANGWLGSRVVATELAQYMITLHLLLAICVVFALLFALTRAKATTTMLAEGVRNSMLSRLLLITMVLTLGQVLLGTQVRDALDQVVRRLGYDQRADWIGQLNWSFYIHRSFSLIILAFHLSVIRQLQKQKTAGRANLFTALLLAIVITEIATGAIMAYFAVPAFAQPVHLLLAILMVSLQFVIWLNLTPGLNKPERVIEPTTLLNA